MADDKRPVIKSFSELTFAQIMKANDIKGTFLWYHITADDEAYMGWLDEDDPDMTVDDYAAMLERIPDEEIFAEPPADSSITFAPDDLDEVACFVKYIGIKRYRPDPKRKQPAGFEGKDHLLREVLNMEKVSKRPHPYIVRYLGCRLRRGRITGIVLERLGQTLLEYATETPRKFARLSKAAFLAGVESAVSYMHSLGLAHNDICPNNIMVREDDDGSCSPVLVDLGSGGPFGVRMFSGGSPGFVDLEDPDLFVSARKHDEYSLDRIREWWDDMLRKAQEVPDEEPAGEKEQDLPDGE